MIPTPTRSAGALRSAAAISFKIYKPVIAVATLICTNIRRLYPQSPITGVSFCQRFAFQETQYSGSPLFLVMMSRSNLEASEPP